MHLKAVIVKRRPSKARRMQSRRSASPPFAAMFSALGRLRACARDKDKMKWLHNCQPDSDNDVSVGSFEALAPQTVNNDAALRDTDLQTRGRRTLPKAFCGPRAPSPSCCCS